jgi:hypothetical protein
MTPTRLASFAVLVLVPVSASAQVIQRPERAAEVVSRRTDTERSSQSLNVGFNLMGGYDTNETDDRFDPTLPDLSPVIIDSTSLITFDASVDYMRVQRTRLFGARFTGATTHYTDTTTDVGPGNNFGAELTFETPMGTATRFNASQRFTYDRLFSLGGFEPIQSDVPITELPTSTAGGVAEIPSILSDTNVGLQQRVGRRGNLGGTYGYVRQVFTGDAATGDSNSHRAGATYAYQMKRTTALTMSYAYSSGEYAPLLFTSGGGGGGTRPLVGHSILGGFDMTKRLSPRRAVQFALGLGATRTQAVTGDDDIEYAWWAPSASLSTRIDLGRTWALSANYSHGQTSLSGLTREAYSGRAASTSLGGKMGPVDIAATAGFTWGSTGAGAALSSDYESLTGTLQAGMPIGKRLNAVVQYTWYQYDVTGEADVPVALPPGYTRNSIRAGLSVRLPVIETRATR